MPLNRIQLAMSHSKAYEKRPICGKFQLCISIWEVVKSKSRKSGFCRISTILVYYTFLLQRHISENRNKFLNWCSELRKIKNAEKMLKNDSCVSKQLQNYNNIFTVSSHHCYYCPNFFRFLNLLRRSKKKIKTDFFRVFFCGRVTYRSNFRTYFMV